MKTNSSSDTLARRDFLKGAGVAGVAGVAAVAVSGNKAEAVSPEATEDGGYQETEHVMKYYELSRF